MFALSIVYLTGRAVAASYTDRDQPEWPPHPVRVFSALVAALHDNGNNPLQREALQWLERQGPPMLAAPAADRRDSCTSFVPANDATTPRIPAGRNVDQKDLAVLPENRGRRPRTFPSVTPRGNTVVLLWPRAECPTRLVAAVEGLVDKVSYLGHSASLVRLRLCADPPPPSHNPASEGDLIVRVAAAGQLEALERAYQVFLKTGVRGRLPCGFQAYTAIAKGDGQVSPRRHSVFGPMVIFRRRQGPPLPVIIGPTLAATLRDTAMALCGNPVPEVLSGHKPDGSQSERPHLAFVPLPDVGHPHADGHLLGVAVILPREVTGEDRRRVLRALGRVERLTMGAVGAWEVERVTTDTVQRGLSGETWVGPASRWASVTPIVLDAFPKPRPAADVATIIDTACERVGLPCPTSVEVLRQPLFRGAPRWQHYRRSAHTRIAQRPLVHVVLQFPELVEGPVLIGAGRYRGLGLCRPLFHVS